MSSVPTPVHSGPARPAAIVEGRACREDAQKNTRYYLAGTMTSVTYSVVVALCIRVSLEALASARSRS